MYLRVLTIERGGRDKNLSKSFHNHFVGRELWSQPRRRWARQYQRKRQYTMQRPWATFAVSVWDFRKGTEWEGVFSVSCGCMLSTRAISKGRAGYYLHRYHRSQTRRPCKVPLHTTRSRRLTRILQRWWRCSLLWCTCLDSRRSCRVFLEVLLYLKVVLPPYN